MNVCMDEIFVRPLYSHFHYLLLCFFFLLPRHPSGTSLCLANIPVMFLCLARAFLSFLLYFFFLFFNYKHSMAQSASKKMKFMKNPNDFY